MLTTPAETSEQEFLQRRSAARNPEPEVSEPTEENVEAVDELESSTNDEEVTPEVIEASDNQEVESEAVTTDDDGEDLYVEYKGREINLKDIEEWEQGSLRQADYTRKTQALAKEREDFEAKQTEVNDSYGKLDGQIKTLEAIIAQDTLNAEELTELREDDPEAYIAYKEKQESRQKILAEAKSTVPPSQTDNIDVTAERKKIWDNNPDWLDAKGEVTEKHKSDMALVGNYAKEIGYSQEEVAGIKHAHHMQTLLEAAKYRQMKSNNSAIEKQVRLAPVSTKPRKAATSGLEQQIKEAKAKLKQTGSINDATALRKLQRKLSEK